MFENLKIRTTPLSELKRPEKVLTEFWSDVVKPLITEKAKGDNYNSWISKGLDENDNIQNDTFVLVLDNDRIPNIYRGGVCYLEHEFITVITNAGSYPVTIIGKGYDQETVYKDISLPNILREKLEQLFKVEDMALYFERYLEIEEMGSIEHDPYSVILRMGKKLEECFNSKIEYDLIKDEQYNKKDKKYISYLVLYLYGLNNDCALLFMKFKYNNVHHNQDYEYQTPNYPITVSILPENGIKLSFESSDEYSLVSQLEKHLEQEEVQETLAQFYQSII